MNSLSSRWITHDPQIFEGKAIFVRSRTMVNALMRWLVSGMKLSAFLSIHKDVEEDVAIGALQQGFSLQIHEYVTNGRNSLASLSIAHDPEICQGKPIFINSQTPVEALAEWLGSGGSLTRFLKDHPDVGEGCAEGTIELCFGYLAKNYFDQIEN